MKIFLKKFGINISKGDYWQIANLMQAEEIHNDIKKMLDDLYSAMENINSTSSPK